MADRNELERGYRPEDGRRRAGDTRSRTGARHVQVQPDRAREPRYERAPRSMGFWTKVLIPVTVVLVVLVAFLAVGFTYANRVAKLNTIYPNVTVNGVSVGGMTVDEAAAVLGDDPDRYDGAAVTVNFPTGDSVTVSAQDLGLQALDGASFAHMAYSYGRGGTLLSNLMAYRACEDEPVDIAVDTAKPAIDENVLTQLITPVAETVDQKLGVVKAEIGENDIKVVKNMGTAHVDVPALCAQLKTAFEQENYATIDYEVPETETALDEDAVDVDAMLQRLYDEVYVEPVSAQYDPATGAATQSVQGVRIDQEEARRQWDAARTGETVTIPLIREDPEVTTEQLSGQLFADVLSEKSTSLSGSTSARINNITLAAAAMNGKVLQPGEEFDYNACLGERTAAKGYQSAGAFSGGQHVMSIGGGICQGSSTLYYCALKANLSITDRWCHQFVVGYLPRGMDATVSWGWPDFKFVNSRSFPIKIEAWVADGYLTIRILGTDVDGTYVELTNETWEDGAHYYAQTYRNIYDASGNLISSQKEAYSSYDKEEALAAAAATPEPEVPAAPEVPEVQESQPVEEAPPPAMDIFPEEEYTSDMYAPDGL